MILSAGWANRVLSISRAVRSTCPPSISCARCCIDITHAAYPDYICEKRNMFAKLNPRLQRRVVGAVLGPESVVYYKLEHILAQIKGSCVGAEKLESFTTLASMKVQRLLVRSAPSLLMEQGNIYVPQNEGMFVGSQPYTESI